MARTIKADKIRIEAPTEGQARRMWLELIGDDAVAIEAGEIEIKVNPSLYPRIDPREIGPGAVRQT